MAKFIQIDTVDAKESAYINIEQIVFIEKLSDGSCTINTITHKISTDAKYDYVISLLK